jgi:hypothetical protein
MRAEQDGALISADPTVTHTGTAIGSIGDYRGPATAWFRLHLMGDESARGLFYGSSCGLCSDSDWRVERRGIQ